MESEEFNKGLELFKEISRLNSMIYNDYRITQAKTIIRLAKEKFGRLAVAFSGGKDSLVALQLVLQEDPDALIVFNNTGIEFPDTIKYIKQLEKEKGLKINIVHPKSPFFKLVKEYGWPSHGKRWCCVIVKDQPAENFIKEAGVNVEVTGVTRYESLYRRCLSPITVYKKSPIVRINPLYDWNEREIWGYIKGNNLSYNPLYNLKYKRVGCWCCPLNGVSHYKRLKKTHSSLYNFLLNFKPAHPIVHKLENGSWQGGVGHERP